MKRSAKALFAAFLAFFVAFSARATHIIGGEITYKCLGNDLYEITLYVFRDCYNGIPPFDSPASVGIYSIDWGTEYQDLLLFPLTDDTLDVVLSNPCLQVPPDVCVNSAVYRGTVNLPHNPAGGYNIIYQRCCRNNLIQNIVNPEDAGATFITRITDAGLLAGCNSSPTFINWPPIAICVREPINWDHSATDAEGDSLVYKLCWPQNGASDIAPMPQPPDINTIFDLPFMPGYGLTDFLNGGTGDPADRLKIDPKTGYMTGVPNMLGNFVVAVCLEEYRNGQLLTRIQRDFQYNVSDCGAPNSAFFAPDVLCDSKTVSFENESFNSSGSEWYFDWPSATPFSTEKNPTHTFADTGVYKVALVSLSPNPVCVDTFFKEITVTLSHLTADFDFQVVDCNGPATVKVTDLTTDSLFALAKWDWSISNGLQTFKDTARNPTFTVPAGAGVWTLTLTATSANGCTETLVKTFSSPHVDLSVIDEKLAICPGFSETLSPNANPSYSYAWAPPTFLSATNVRSPVVTPTSDITYTVTVSNGPCTATKTVEIEVIEPQAMTATASPDTILIGETSQLAAQLAIGSGTDWSWSPDANLSDANGLMPVAKPSETTLYTVTATDPSGCTSAAQALVVVINPSCEEPFVFFPNAFSPNGDGKNDVLKVEGFFIESINWIIYDRWGEKLFEAKNPNDVWDGTFLGETLPPDSYGFYLRARCVGGSETVRKGNVSLLR